MSNPKPARGTYFSLIISVQIGLSVCWLGALFLLQRLANRIIRNDPIWEFFRRSKNGDDRAVYVIAERVNVFVIPIGMLILAAAVWSIILTVRQSRGGCDSEATNSKR